MRKTQGNYPTRENAINCFLYNTTGWVKTRAGFVFARILEHLRLPKNLLNLERDANCLIFDGTVLIPFVL